MFSPIDELPSTLKLFSFSTADNPDADTIMAITIKVMIF